MTRKIGIIIAVEQLRLHDVKWNFQALSQVSAVNSRLSAKFVDAGSEL
jgi:hypothetical protein